MSQWLAGKAYILGRWLERKAVEHSPEISVGAVSASPSAVPALSIKAAGDSPEIPTQPPVASQASFATPLVEDTPFVAADLPAAADPFEPAPASMGGETAPQAASVEKAETEEVPPAAPTPTALDAPESSSSREGSLPRAAAPAFAAGLRISASPPVVFAQTRPQAKTDGWIVRSVPRSEVGQRILSPTSTFPATSTMLTAADIAPRAARASDSRAGGLQRWPSQAVTAKGNVHQYP